MNIDKKYFKNVPVYQKEMFFNFINTNKYKQISLDNCVYDYLIINNNKEKTIVLLHGGLVNPYMWFFVITKLKEYFNIIAPKFPIEGISANDSIELIKSILIKENTKKTHILGYSFGGGVAQYFAEKYPEYIDKLILSHTGVIRKSKDIEKSIKMIKIIKALPTFVISIIKFLRINFGKESKWYQFKKAYFSQIFKLIDKNVFVKFLYNGLEFLHDINYLPIGKVTWKGETIIINTNTDKNTFKYFGKLKEMYHNNISYVFNNPGGHHTVFLYPEEYIEKLLNLLVMVIL